MVLFDAYELLFTIFRQKKMSKHWSFIDSMVGRMFLGSATMIAGWVGMLMNTGVTFYYNFFELAVVERIIDRTGGTTTSTGGS